MSVEWFHCLCISPGLWIIILYYNIMVTSYEMSARSFSDITLLTSCIVTMFVTTSESFPENLTVVCVISVVVFENRVMFVHNL